MLECFNENEGVNINRLRVYRLLKENKLKVMKKICKSSSVISIPFLFFSFSEFNTHNYTRLIFFSLFRNLDIYFNNPQTLHKFPFIVVFFFTTFLIQYPSYITPFLTLYTFLVPFLSHKNP